MSKQNFDKFINVKVKGAKKKEQIKQEKKLAKKEREAFFIEKKRELRAAKKLQDELTTGKSKRLPEKKFNIDPAGPANETGNPRGSSGKVHLKKKDISGKKERPQLNEEKIKKPFPGNQPQPLKPGAAKPARGTDKQAKKEKDTGSGPKGFKKTTDAGLPYQRKPVAKEVKVPEISKRPVVTRASKSIATENPAGKKEQKIPAKKETGPATETPLMPLNKYIAHGGVCSRRDAGELVKAGKVTVNGQVVSDPGYKVQEGDLVKANGKLVTPKAELVYILLNKPKDFITTVDDPQGRKTVLDIVKSATTERIYPVGRLDRNTSGVLLLTNDGELAQQLTHPSFEVRKIYEAKLDKPLAKADFEKLVNGVTLEDGQVHADSLAYGDSKDKSIIGIEIHSGRNRVVRRMFEHLGYEVKGLDRVMFANLTKKNVERGKWRFLNDKEVRLLKFFNKSKR